MRELWDADDIASGQQVRAQARPLPVDRRVLVWLDETDRLIWELAEQHASVRLIARAVKLNSGTVSRRITAMRRRFALPIVGLMLETAIPVPDEARKIALLHHAGGLSCAAIARKLNVSESSVREHVRYAAGISSIIQRRRAIQCA
jgi:IS30 family transposase